MCDWTGHSTPQEPKVPATITVILSHVTAFFLISFGFFVCEPIFFPLNERMLIRRRTCFLFLSRHVDGFYSKIIDVGSTLRVRLAVILEVVCAPYHNPRLSESLASIQLRKHSSTETSFTTIPSVLVLSLSVQPASLETWEIAIMLYLFAFRITTSPSITIPLFPGLQ